MKICCKIEVDTVHYIFSVARKSAPATLEKSISSTGVLPPSELS